jgi:hypothetical protein
LLLLVCQASSFHPQTRRRFALCAKRFTGRANPDRLRTRGVNSPGRHPPSRFAALERVAKLLLRQPKTPGSEKQLQIVNHILCVRSDRLSKSLRFWHPQRPFLLAEGGQSLWELFP